MIETYKTKADVEAITVPTGVSALRIGGVGNVGDGKGGQFIRVGLVEPVVGVGACRGASPAALE